MEFRRIKDKDDQFFHGAMDLYLEAFPLNEQHPLALIRERVIKDQNQLYVGIMDGAVSLMALLWPLKDTAFILLDYLATHPAQRNLGFGSAFLIWLRLHLATEKKHCIIEVEKPGFGPHRVQREKRIAFYKRHGARELQNVPFILPALQEGPSTEMVLMIYPAEQDAIPASLVKQLIGRIYKELYGRGPDDPLLLSLQQQLKGPQIKLIG